MTKCMNCMPGKPCFAQDNYKVYRNAEYGLVPENEDAIMQEIA